MRLKSRVQHFGNRCNQQSLRQSRHAGNDGVSTAEHRHHDLIDDIILADNNFANFGVDPLQFDMEAFNGFEILLLLYG